MVYKVNKLRKLIRVAMHLLLKVGKIDYAFKLNKLIKIEHTLILVFIVSKYVDIGPKS